MITIGLLGVCRPLVRAVELFDEPLWQQPLEVAHKDDVVFAVEVNPTLIAVTGVATLGLTSRCSVENLVQRLLMDIPQHHVEVLTERHITVAMHHEATHDALAPRGNS